MMRHEHSCGMTQYKSNDWTIIGTISSYKQILFASFFFFYYDKW